MLPCLRREDVDGFGHELEGRHELLVQVQDAAFQFFERQEV